MIEKFMEHDQHAPDKASYPAIYNVQTVNGIEPCCEKHMQKLAGLMQFMGSYANISVNVSGTECNNCRNEANKTNGSN